MPTAMQPQSVKNLGVYGLIRQAEVDDRLIPDQAVTEVVNFSFDRKGASTVRPGITGIGSTLEASSTINMIMTHLSSTLTAVVNTGLNGGATVYRWGTTNSNTPSAWVNTGLQMDQTGISARKTRTIDFLGYTLIYANNPVTSLSYSPWPYAIVATSGSPLNMHQFASSVATLRASLAEVYKSRMYLAGDPTFPSRLFFSSVVSGATASVQGSITWTPTTDFVDINPGDGENISGLKRYSLELLVFKPNYIYRFKTSGLDPDPLIKVGTRSQESIIEGKRGLYFHHDSGFYRYSGGYPEEISRSISDIILAIPRGQYEDINAWKDGDHIYWSLAGDITLSSVSGRETFKNVVLRYTESSDVWTVYSYPRNITAGGIFISAASNSIVVGTNEGVVAEFNKGTADIEYPIKYRLITKWYEWEGIETQKVIQMLVTVCEKAQAANLFYQTNENAEWIEVGQLKSFLTFFDNLKIKHNRIRFKIAGVSRDEPPVFLGIEIPLGINEGIIKS